MTASKKAQEFSQWASEKQREECPISDLWISVKCGESDTTSGNRLPHATEAGLRPAAVAGGETSLM